MWFGILGTSSARAVLRSVLAAGIAAACVGEPAQGQPDAARRLKVCMVSLNEPDEVEAFRSHLDPQQFELVAIRGAATSTYSPHQARRKWAGHRGSSMPADRR